LTPLPTAQAFETGAPAFAGGIAEKLGKSVRARRAEVRHSVPTGVPFEPQLSGRASNEQWRTREGAIQWRGRRVLSGPKSIAQALILMLGIAFVAQKPSTVEAAGLKNSRGPLGGFGARGGWNRGGQTLNGTPGHRRAAGGDADLRVRLGSYPTVTQTARPGFWPGTGIGGGWNMGGPGLEGPAMRSAGGRVLHPGKSSPQRLGRSGPSVGGLNGAGTGQQGGNGRSDWSGWSEFYRSF
jgi:hypothetical protein